LFLTFNLLLCLVREYFANRNLAQQVKSRIENYEKGGGFVVEKGDVNSNNSNNNNNNAVVRQAGRRPSDADQQQDWREEQDPEKRIAMIKAQREKERERELAEKEMQVRLFILYFYLIFF
jgi:G3E family GTPase